MKAKEKNIFYCRHVKCISVFFREGKNRLDSCFLVCSRHICSAAGKRKKNHQIGLLFIFFWYRTEKEKKTNAIVNIVNKTEGTFYTHNVIRFQ
jgi:hypothetical protein